MPDMTSIKVPRALRDRLAVRAAAQQTTLAGALSSALDDAEAQLFWSTVRAENARSSRENSDETEPFDVTLSDDLADPADDAIGTDGW